MLLFILFTFFLMSSLSESQTVYIKKSFDIADGKFLIFERYENEVILNEYATFYSELSIPKFTAIYDDYGAAGSVIGSFENYYPITSLKSDLMCGHFSVKQLMNSSRMTITYRDLTWENAEDFLEDVDHYIDSSIFYLIKEKFCFVYVDRE